MEIKLHNYKNIDELNVDFLDNKINFVYGLSGSGKSSICEAIIDDKPEENVKFGTVASEVLVIPKIDKNSIAIYNGNTKDLLLNEIGSSAVYKIIFNNSGEIDEIYNELNNHFRMLNECRPKMNEFLTDMIKLKKEIGISRSNATSFPKNKKDRLSCLEKEAESDKYRKNYYFLKRNSVDYLKWIINGSKLPYYYENGKCPFCHRKLTESKKKRLNEIISLTPENYEALSSSITYQEVFKLDVPNYSSKRSIKKVKKEIEELFEVEIEVKKLLNLFDSLNTSNLDIQGLKKFEVSEMLERQLPELSASINVYNDSLKKIKSLATQMISKTNTLVKNNLKLLNNYLKILGIPYYFQIGKYTKTDKIASTYLVHKDNEVKDNNIKCLSYGEKNIVSLLLFILGTTEENIVIDDPASSFDENRRTIIYRLIMDNLCGKTVIVLSHDQSFIKNAMIDIKQEMIKSKNENWQDAALTKNIGRILYVSSNNYCANISNINLEDYDNLSSHVRNFMLNNDLSYFRKIINLRIFFEEYDRKNDKECKEIYGYLSAIMHYGKLKTREAVINDLKSLSEEEILNLIKNKCSISLEPLPEDRFYDFDIDELTQFEKVFYTRESINKNSSDYKELNKYAKDTLSDIVHLNNQTVYTLNPYKYVSYPQNVLDIVDQRLKEKFKL